MANTLKASLPKPRFGENCLHHTWKGSRLFIETIIRPFHTNKLETTYNTEQWHKLCTNCCNKILIETDHFQYFFDQFDNNKAFEMYPDKPTLLINRYYYTWLFISLLKRPQIIKYFYRSNKLFIHLLDGILMINDQWEMHKFILSHKNVMYAKSAAGKEANIVLQTICDDLWTIICVFIVKYIKINNIKFIINNSKFMKHYFKPIFIKTEIFSACKFIYDFQVYDVFGKHNMHSDAYLPINVIILITLYRYLDQLNLKNKKKSDCNYLTLMAKTFMKNINKVNKKKIKLLLKKLDLSEDKVNKCYKNVLLFYRWTEIKNMENKMRCNNPICNRDCLVYKYGDNYKQLFLNDFKNMKKYQKNKWYKCKSCKMVYYCEILDHTIFKF